MNSMTVIKTAIWMPVIRTEEDYDLLPDGWKGTGLQGFNVYRASVLERQEALAAKASRARRISVEVIPVRATPQYMLRALADRAYTVETTNTVARLLALSPDFHPAREYD